jgi:bifunctional enzyme CysN/CysC
MITGASRADAAVLVIAANEGVREQSRRHAYLLSLLGIKQVIVVVNKMDLADFSEDRFRSIESEYREFWAASVICTGFVPASAAGNVMASVSRWDGVDESSIIGRFELLQRSTCSAFAFRCLPTLTSAASSPKPEV